MLLSSSRNKFTLLKQNTMAYFSAGFQLQCWCLCGWAPPWRLHTNLYKSEWKLSPHILLKKKCCGLNLGESLCTFTFSLFPDSRLSIERFWLLFWSVLNCVTLKTSNCLIDQSECCGRQRPQNWTNWSCFCRRSLSSPLPLFLPISPTPSPCACDGKLLRKMRKWHFVIYFKILTFHRSGTNMRNIEA